MADVSALGSCVCLHTLDLGRTKVVDVSALGSCVNMHFLDLYCCWNVQDVSALRNCANLRFLKVGYTNLMVEPVLWSDVKLSGVTH